MTLDSINYFNCVCCCT